MNTIFKKITAVISAAAIALAAAALPADISADTGLDIPAAADSSILDTLPTGGLYDPEPVAITEEEADAISEAVRADYEKAVPAADATNSPITGYDHSTDYFYDQLSADLRKVWDDLEAACDAFMTSTVDLTNASGSGYSFNVYSLSETIDVKSNLLTKDQLKSFYTLFKQSNPQYYFLYSYYYYYSGNYVTGIIPTVLGDCATYAGRAKFNNAIRSTTLSWMSEIETKTTILEKELYICELIKDFIEYDHAAVSATPDWHDQTIIGVFYDKLAVCAGYTAAVSYMCNAAGIDCFGVVSSNHAWNKVNLYGTWYETDVTWYDTGKSKTWLNKSHSTIVANDNQSAHGILTENYTVMGVDLPDCTSDTVKTVTGISVSKLPTKTDYDIGDALDVTGGKVKVTFDDSSSIIVDMSDCKTSGFSSAAAGTKTVTVTFDGKTATFSVTVGGSAPTVTGISMKSLPTKTVYYIGDELDITGGVIKVTYSDSSTESVDITASMISGFSSAAAGEKTVTVSYSGYTTTFTVTVKADTVKEITVKAPTKTSYIVGEDLDVTGGSVTATYASGKTENIAMNDSAVTVSGFDSSKAGNVVVTVTYKGCSDTFTVTVNNDTVTEITVKAPTKTSYIVGEDLDVTGGSVTATYASGKTENIAMTDSAVTVSGFDSSKAGNVVVTVSYKGCSDTFTVIVAENTAKSIEITTLPKETYYVGEDLDVTGGIITVTYTDGSTDTVVLTASMISGFSTETAGTKTVTVSYGGFAATYTITVINDEVIAISVDTAPKTEYFIGDKLDLTGGIIEVNYASGRKEQIPMTDAAVTVSGFDTSKTGASAVTVSYKGISTFYNITVITDDVSSITIKTLPRTNYRIGDDLDVASGVITAAYHSGKTKDIPMTAAMVSGFDSADAGTFTLTVTYEGCTAEYNITVAAAPVVTSVEITTTPKTAYIVNDTLDVTGGKLKATYSDGTTQTVDITAAMVSGFDSTAAGTFTLTVTYEGCTAEYNITVAAAPVVTSVEITTTPKAAYIVNDTLDVTGGKLKATYSDGTTQTVDITAAMVSGFDSSAAGTFTLTVTYEGCTAEYTITVSEAPTYPVTVNGVGYDDIYTALNAIKKYESDVDILLAKSVVMTSKMTLPAKATSITIRATSRKISINMKNSSLTFNCPVVIESIQLNNNKGEPIAITAKKDITVNNAEIGTLKASGNVTICGGATVRGSVTVSTKAGTAAFDESVIAGNVNVSSKNTTTEFTGVMLINGTATTAGHLSVSGECTIHGKFTPKASIEIDGELTAMWD